MIIFVREIIDMIIFVILRSLSIILMLWLTKQFFGKYIYFNRGNETVWKVSGVVIAFNIVAYLIRAGFMFINLHLLGSLSVAIATVIGLHFARRMYPKEFQFEGKYAFPILAACLALL